MKQLRINIQENKLNFILELLRNFEFVQIESEESDNKKQLLSNLKQGFKEMQGYKKGKLKITPAKDFLDEL